jgi:TPR repeat protein
VGLVRDHLLPHAEQADARYGVDAVASSADALGSSSVNLAIAPPRDAFADQLPQQPGADADRPDAVSRSAPASDPASRPAADRQPLSAVEIAALVVRGDAFLVAGDIASARLLFERAAESEDRRAALRLAVTYDAAFLKRVGIHGLLSDPEQAAFWYRRARELGAGKPEPPPGGPGAIDLPEPLSR